MKRIFVIAGFLLFFSTLVFSEKINLAIIGGDLAIVSKTVLETAYNRLGYEVTFTDLPPKRAFLESNNGEFDGETHRIEGIEKTFKNLIPIEIPINYLQLLILSKKYNIYIDSKDKLKGYSIGYQRGIIISENYVKGLNGIAARDDIINLRKLAAGRLDFVVIVGTDARELLSNNQYPDIKILEPVVQTVKLYHYVHKKHADLVPKLTKILKEMEAKGEIEKIRAEKLNYDIK